MSFYTNIGFSGDGTEYGKWTTDKNGNDVFISYGKTVSVDRILVNIENGEVFLDLSFDYYHRRKQYQICRKQIAEPALLTELAGAGADVTRKLFDALVDSLRLQELELEESGAGISNVYRNLGWIDVPIYDDNGQQCGNDLCYRANELLGPQSGKYIGQYDVREQGSFESWRQMVISDVIGHSVLELVLVAALAAVVNGLVAPARTGENPIIHLNYSSGKGKSTAGYLAVSTAGKPFDGTERTSDETGNVVNRQSLYQSWSATSSALITSQAGNRGAIVVLNELGKCQNADMVRFVFDASEGSDKKRLTTNLTTRLSERFTTVFISTGESSLLEKCKSKLEGLRVRVMEIDKPITDSAEHANRIKETCREHCGHAAPKLVKYIIENGGRDLVLPLYDNWSKRLKEEMPQSPNGARFHEKFSALFLATAELAAKALDIPFDIDGLYHFLMAYEQENGASRNTSAGSYDYIIEQCRINANKFYHKNGKGVAKSKMDETAFAPLQDCWGRITKVSYSINGKNVVEEFEVRPSIVDRLLERGGYENRKTCEKEWIRAGLLNHDKDRPTRGRKIEALGSNTDGIKAEDVFVFLVFADEKDTDRKESNGEDIDDEDDIA